MALEKRSEQRYMVNWPLQIGRSYRGWVNCKTVDISAAGFLFVSTDQYRADELVLFEIAIRPTVLVYGIARIVRAIDESTRLNRYAAEYRVVSADSRRLLKETLLAIRRRSLNEMLPDGITPAVSRLATVRRADVETPAVESSLSRWPVITRRVR